MRTSTRRAARWASSSRCRSTTTRPRRRSRRSSSSAWSARARSRSPDPATPVRPRRRWRDRLQVPDIGAVDDAGITIYPNGPAKPPLPWVWSWGLNTFAFGGIDASYAIKHCKGLALLHDPSSYGDGGEAGIKLVLSKAHQKLAVDDAITEDWSSGATVGLTNEIDKIKSSHASCVVVWLTPQDTARFMDTIKSSGVNVTILGNDEIDADTTFSGLAGSAGNGAIGAELSRSCTRVLRSSG